MLLAPKRPFWKPAGISDQLTRRYAPGISGRLPGFGCPFVEGPCVAFVGQRGDLNRHQKDHLTPKDAEILFSPAARGGLGVRTYLDLRALDAEREPVDLTRLEQLAQTNAAVATATNLPGG